ncbi:MAG TPA: DUF6448 family protein, partial [Methanomassiliicoccales archaeon]|nr:DUF6448 family protein [Methanomassiliicoccales archaeon]
HRAGEGEPYTGLKPGGIDWGPIVPMSEKAMASGIPDAVIDMIKGGGQAHIEGTSLQGDGPQGLHCE